MCQSNVPTFFRRGMYRGYVSSIRQKQTETMLEQDALLHPHTPEKNPEKLIGITFIMFTFLPFI